MAEEPGGGAGGPGTLFACVLGHAVFIHDREVVERPFPVMDRNGPRLGGFTDGHVDELQCRLVVWVDLPILGGLANHAVE